MVTKLGCLENEVILELSFKGEICRTRGGRRKDFKKKEEMIYGRLRNIFTMMHSENFE